MIDFRVGDCRDVLAELEADSIEACVTDPPYGLGFMGKGWDHGVPGVEFWQAVYRVLKPGAHLVAFGGTRTFHRLAVALEDAGFELRDTLAWLYGSGFPKSLDVGKAIDREAGAERRWQGWGTALKPAWEPIILARKPLSGTVAETVLEHGTGALNVDGCRIAGAKGNGVWGSSNATVRRERSFNASPDMDDYRSEQHEAGRWPANVVLDEAAAEMLDSQAGDAGAFAPVRGTEPRADGMGGQSMGRGGKRRDVGPFYGDSGGPSRFFYCAKADRMERDAGLNHVEKKPLRWSSGAQSPGTFQSENTERAARNNHPTVKPLALMRWLVRMVSPPGATVLDPFMGSGTTMIAANTLGFSGLGIDRELEYVAIARARVENTVYTAEDGLKSRAVDQLDIFNQRTVE